MERLPNIDKEATGGRLRRLMRLRHISIFDLQKRFDFCSPSNIYAWRRGDRLPSVENLYQLAYILDCKMDDIIVREELPDGKNTRSTMQRL